MMAAEAGGRIATVRMPDGRIAPRDAMYRVRIDLQDDSQLQTSPTMQLGSVSIEGDTRSPLVAWLTTAASVFIRESGF
jgi:hypothetical protein